jgi:hypothetical protein
MLTMPLAELFDYWLLRETFLVLSRQAPLS